MCLGPGVSVQLGARSEFQTRATGDCKPEVVSGCDWDHRQFAAGSLTDCWNKRIQAKVVFFKL